MDKIKENAQRLLSQVPADLVALAVLALRERLDRDPEDVPTLRRWISENPDNWWAVPRGGDRSIGFPGVSFHFSGGMSVRNALRQMGFGERQLGIDNLDDIYIELIERAVAMEP